MDKLQEMGEFVRSASSTIEAPVVRRLKEAFAAQASPGTGRLASRYGPPPLRSLPGPGAPRPGPLLGEPVPPRPGAPLPPRPGAPRPAPPSSPASPSSSGAPIRRSRPVRRPAARSTRVDAMPFQNLVHDGRKRLALSLSIASFGGTDDDLDYHPRRPWPPAIERAVALREALALLGYSSSQPAISAGSARAPDPEVDAATSAADRDEILVVHIIGYGHLIASDVVSVVGSDGETYSLTDLEHRLKAAEKFPDGLDTLFLLDLCHGGDAAYRPGQVALTGGSGRARVIAACEPDGQAFDGRFTQAVASVLGRLYRSQLDIDRSVRYMPLATMAREIHREVDASAPGQGTPPPATWSVIDISADADAPFFPNPDYFQDERYAVRRQIDTALAAFWDDLDDAFDARRAVGRARYNAAMTDHIGSGCFSGRDDELIALTGWMNGDEDGTIRLVTGSAEAGKSVLIGILVCAAHPVLRKPTRFLWDHVAHVPDPIPYIAAVHARQRGIAEITQSLAGQLGLDGCLSAYDLVERIRQSPTLPLLVVDALDQALEPTILLDQLLLPLATARHENGAPVCRLLVAARSDPEFARLRDFAIAENGLIDLDDIGHDRLRRDLEDYVDKLLKSQAPYDRRTHAQARAAFAAAVADALVSRGVSRHTGRRWNIFLVAALYTNHVLVTYEPIEDSRIAEQLALQVPAELPEVLELDLGSQSDIPFLRPVLAILANTLGKGMPASLIQAIVPFFAENRRPSEDEVTEAIEVARVYLRHTADTDGTKIYRLFHQGLAEYLRQHPVEPATSARPADIAEGILFQILRTLSAEGENGDLEHRQWAFAEPYLLRHALQHAIDAGRPALVASDPEFLVHADPAIIGPFLASTSAPGLLPIAEIYRSALGQRGFSNLNDRRQALAFAAARGGLTDLTRRLASPPGQPSLAWRPVWSATHQPPINGGADSGSFGPVTTAIVVDLLSGPAVVALTAEGAIVSFDLATGKKLHRWPGFYADCRLRELHIGGQSAIIASSGNQQLICLDPATGADFTDIRELGDTGDAFLEGAGLVTHVSRSTSNELKLLSIMDGRIVVTSAGGDALCVGDFTTGELVGELADERSGPATTLASWVLDGRPVIVSGTEDGKLCMWDLASRMLRDVLALHQPVEITIPASRHYLVVVAGGDILVLQRTADTASRPS